MATPAEAGLGPNPEARNSIRSPLWVAGAQVFELSSAALQGMLAGTKVGNRATRIQTSANIMLVLQAAA